MKLVLVESPKKCESLRKILGPGYTVLGCAGHFMELAEKSGTGPRSKYGVDIMNGYKPIWSRTSTKQRFISKIKDAARGVSEVIIATDDDREGEAIGWHLMRELRLNPLTTHRLIFKNITKEEIQRAMSQPTRLNQKRVDAAIARQISDKIVGYELSPVLWRHLGRGLSAGRVQSVVTRLVVDHERKIKAFRSEGYYTVEGDFLRSDPMVPNPNIAKTTIHANYVPAKLTNLAEARNHMEAIQPKHKWSIDSITPRESKRAAPAPFVTSTLQQEASNRLGWSPKHTMKIAQSLYEGGHITYMRTDSSVLSKEAMAALKGVIMERWGENYYAGHQFTETAKGSQEAHEAIRPTKVNLSSLAGVDGQESRLYSLIWKRTVASQMAPEEVRTTTYSLKASAAPTDSDKTDLPGGFNHKRVQSIFPGYKVLYKTAAEEESGEPTSIGEEFYASLKIGSQFFYQRIEAKEGMTNPPSRFTEASIIAKLEDASIGRPSTWSSIVDKIQSRSYVEKKDLPGREIQLTNLLLRNPQTAIKEVAIKAKTRSENRKLVPTELGTMVTEFLEREFSEIMDYGFTAEMESELDMICQGTKSWQGVVDRYWQGLDPKVSLLSKKEIEGGIKRERDKKERYLGTTADGRRVSATVARHGACIRVDPNPDSDRPELAGLSKQGAKSLQKTQFWSLEPGMTLSSVTLDEALRIISIPKAGKILGGDPFKPVVLKNGRYGFYIQSGDKTETLPTELDPYTLTLETAQQVLMTNSTSTGNVDKRVIPGVGELVPSGRYGPFIRLESGGNLGLKKLRVSLTDFMALTDEEAKKLVVSKAGSPAGGRGRGRGTSRGRGSARGRGTGRGTGRGAGTGRGRGQGANRNASTKKPQLVPLITPIIKKIG